MNSASLQFCFAQSLCRGLRECEQFAVHIAAIDKILFKRFLGADRLLLTRRHDRSTIDTGGTIACPPRVPPKNWFDVPVMCETQIRDSPNSDFVQSAKGLFADTRYDGNRQWIQLLVAIVRSNDGKPVRFVQIGCDFRDQLVFGNADRCRQASALVDRLFDALRNVDACPMQCFAGSNIQKRLIERQTFDQRREFPKNLENFCGDLLVSRHSQCHADQVRAAPQCLAHWHCRAHTKLADFVACGGNDSSVAATAHNHRFAAKFRVVALFNRSVERIHIDMQYCACRGSHNTSCHAQQ